VIEAGDRRPSSEPGSRSRDAVASDPITDALFGTDDRDWLDMAAESGNKSSNQAKSVINDRPRFKGNDDKAAAARQGNVSHLLPHQAGGIM